MRKIFLLVALTLASSFTFAQQENVKKAKSLAKAETPDFEAAKTLIEAALKDETTKNTAETWYVKGFIEFRKFEIQDDKRFEIPPGTPDEDIESEASYKAYVSWVVADSLDVMESVSNPKRKGKLEYRKDIIEKLIAMKPYINKYGAILYGKNDFAGAKKVFEQFSNFPTLEIFKNSDKIKATDSVFIDVRNNIQVATRQLYIQQVAAKDTVAFLKTLNEGIARYPENVFFLSNMIQYNIRMNKEKEALENVNKVLQLNPNNALMYYIRGFIYSLKPDKLKDAEADFTKAMELKPDYPEATYGYGTVLISEADIEYNKGAFNKDPKDADSQMKRADELYKSGVSYLEKARSLNYKDDDMLRILQNTYRKLKMYDKEKEIKTARGL